MNRKNKQLVYWDFARARSGDFAQTRSIIGFVREFWQMRIDLLINTTNNESVLCANFGDLRLRDRELRHKKTVIFGFKSY